MNQPSAFDYLSSLGRFGIRLDLEPLRQVLHRLGEPQLNYPAVLIGGTNGKGSIAAMTASILQAAGLRVGLYTSPHLVDFRERIRVNGAMIGEAEAVALIEALRGPAGESLTYFEFMTAMAFMHFARCRSDMAVLEVGMGGRFDATNVVYPLVCAISNVTREHTEYLGSRLAAIAFEKGGIIKEGGTCITAATQRPVLQVLEDICRERRARLYRVGRDLSVRRHPGGRFSYRGIHRREENLSCPLRGRHQLANGAVALAIIDCLAEAGISVSPEAIAAGLHDTRWEGRMELLRTAPMVLVDGAHNPAGISALCRALREEFSFRRLHVIFGALRDKEVALMVSRLARAADTLILTSPETDRALGMGALRPLAEGCHNRIRTACNTAEALQMALHEADPADMVCVTGSLYLVGEAKKAFLLMSDCDKPTLGF